MKKIPIWQKAVEMEAAGIEAPEIAERLGSTVKSVRSMLSVKRTRDQRLAVYVEPAVSRELQKAARERRMPVDVLASRSLSVVAQDDMFNAVLDDAA